MGTGAYLLFVKLCMPNRDAVQMVVRPYLFLDEGFSHIFYFLPFEVAQKGLPCAFTQK